MDKQKKIKPFLRWAGGKKWLVPSIKELIGTQSFCGYAEPFIGGGSVFLAINPTIAFLSDSNKELINAYTAVKNDPEKLFFLLESYENTAEFYYSMRSSHPDSLIEQAARFIYLNHTSFNGLYRVNQKGEYNVPYGKRKHVSFDYDNIIAVSKRLENAELCTCDFQETILKVQPGYLVYLDPPYVVTKDDTGFIGYNQHLFSLDDQKRLSECLDYIRSVGAYYILSNAKHNIILEIFNKGDRVLEVERTSSIGGKKAYRGKISEYIFTNLPI